MKVEDEAKIRQLDAAVRAQPPALGTASDLFAVVDFVESSASLRRALTDPASTSEARQALSERLFSAKITPEANASVAAAVALRWRNGSVLAAAIERVAVNTLLRVAQSANDLDRVIADLVEFSTTVRLHDGLREAIRDTQFPVSARVALVDRLAASRVAPVALALLNRAVEARERTFALTLEGYLQQAAELRDRQIAHVTVARPLSDEQATRLKNILVRYAGGNLDLQIDIDPAVLGGVRIKFADDQIDSTFAKRLADAERQLTT